MSCFCKTRLRLQRLRNQFDNTLDLDAQIIGLAQITDLSHAIEAIGNHDLRTGLSNLVRFFVCRS